MPDVDRGDHWELDVLGTELSLMKVSWSVALVLTRPGGSLELTVESTFALDGPGARWFLDPSEEPAGLAPVLGLLRRPARRLHVFKDGRLELDLDAGWRISADPDVDYESWNITADSGARFVALPGGGVAYWGPDS
ncbi:DUF6188 family protein [Amycolatopsis sp. CA-230715]|uniref:DUF6188 family protein n=1 Tax=Amycolatopsis sp. CA-230715 TaxID=2745196 RepID=UPI001C0110C3|nr:DUF6188 family protein [Amycolatopsis sp. CA-230715]QWF81520.1 hypothetical protein HUW46_04953 [Amycolatopsis sp. CA-230715]